jgi:hypothetical protein
MKALEPSYHVLAKVDLRLAAFNQSTRPINTLGASDGNNVQAQGRAAQCIVDYLKCNYQSFQETHWHGKGFGTNSK